MALVVVLCAAVGGTVSSFLPLRGDLSGTVAAYFFAVSALAFVVVVVSAFHIAVCDAVQRIEQREKSSGEVDRSV